MNIEHFRGHCLGKPLVTEELPFGPDTLVFKVSGKLFALVGLDEVPGSCNLKCDPDRAELLREQYGAIIPGYHMNKKHWNTVIWDGSVSDQLILELIDHSYNLVVASLPKRKSKFTSGNQVLGEKRINKRTGSRFKKET